MHWEICFILEPSDRQSDCNWELVCRPGMDAGAWIGEKMEKLHDRLGRKKTSSEQESEHHVRPGPWDPVTDFP